jgi:hypothetical protein
MLRIFLLYVPLSFFYVTHVHTHDQPLSPSILRFAFFSPSCVNVLFFFFQNCNFINSSLYQISCSNIHTLILTLDYLQRTQSFPIFLSSPPQHLLWLLCVYNCVVLILYPFPIYYHFVL